VRHVPIATVTAFETAVEAEQSKRATVLVTCWGDPSHVEPMVWQDESWWQSVRLATVANIYHKKQLWCIMQGIDGVGCGVGATLG
jgi:hypothetical protein